MRLLKSIIVDQLCQEVLFMKTWTNGIKNYSQNHEKLNEDDLSRFTGKAMTTWGNANDYKHFLPRIFELTAELKTPYEIWIAFDKL